MLLKKSFMTKTDILLICYMDQTLYDWCPKTAKEFFSTFPYYYGDHWVDKMDETVKSLENLTCTDNNEVIMTPVKKKPVRSLVFFVNFFYYVCI